MEENKINERVEREKIAHTENDILGESYKLKNRFHHIFEYPSRKKLHHYVENLDFEDKVILDYGCGRGEESLKYLANGAKKVFGMDISLNYINEAIGESLKAGFNADRFDFQVMDAHNLAYHDGIFDFVIGNGILHHLDIEVAMNEIFRVLKPGGRVLLFEPLLDNPLLKIFRLFTPNARTEDERPFTKKDIIKITNSNKWKPETMYCGLIEAPIALVTSITAPKKVDNWLMKIANRLENKLNNKKILSNWNQYVLFNLIKE
ncbi:MAG: class I SAM-dependent methyltransferase [Leadbetterella sp.]|nr:class I SAM-dependent methyltransferase [Leadbetterella sp.]